MASRLPSHHEAGMGQSSWRSRAGATTALPFCPPDTLPVYQVQRPSTDRQMSTTELTAMMVGCHLAHGP